MGDRIGGLEKRCLRRSAAGGVFYTTITPFLKEP